ncbi:MAG: hypothetical protein FJ095_01850 [Deltaproteobacteria bacterium]|nr:hypothetical protein [Deltaproteobacteria bacterium]
MTSPSETAVRAHGLPLVARLLLVDPARIDAALARIRDAGTLPHVPNAWQLTLGIARMWHRVVFRSGTIGTCHEDAVRPTVRARILQFRPLRFPFLLRERAVAPLDFSGLLSGRERVIRHLLGAHHDANQFAYDLEMLALEPGALEELRGRVASVLDEDTPRTRFLRDLVVYQRYHEHLASAVERALAGDFGLSERDREDPDISFAAYLGWCARQPATPRATWVELVAGRYSVAEGLC